MNKPDRCGNLNHSRTNVPIRFCPDCGDAVNKQILSKCNDVIHADRRKRQSIYCCDCGKKLRT